MSFPWIKLAFIVEVRLTRTMSEGIGAWLEVDVMPDGPEGATARWFSPYTGKDFGLWAPPMPHDEVIVVAPSGDPAEGLVAFARAWSPSHPPSQRMVDKQEDVVLTVRKDKNIWIEVSGSANAYVLCDTGKVILGDENDHEPATKATTLKQHLDANKQWQTNMASVFAAHFHPGGTIGPGATGTSAAAPPTPPDVPDIAASKVEVGK